MKTCDKIEKIIICDAGPLIVLGKIDRLSLLQACATSVWIPSFVWAEVVERGRGRPPAEWLIQHLSSCVRAGDRELTAAFRLQADAGEAEALALASQNREACLLVDDAKGRTLARLNEIRCIGTLGLLVRARRAGIVSQLSPLFNQLREAGWFIHPNLVQDALRQAGELPSPE